MRNETRRTFQNKVTESRQLIVVEEVIFHGPNVTLAETTALRLAIDFKTVSSDAVPISDLKTSAQREHRKIDIEESFGELWSLAKAATKSPLLAKRDPPPGFVLVRFLSEGARRPSFFARTTSSASLLQ